MNERIWKLAEQIVCFEQDMDGSMEPNEDGQWIRVDELEKFAQSIVQECMTQIQEVREIKAGHAGPEYTQGFDDGMFVAISTIEEHFGVEE
jgi:hypothetical protein